MKLRHKAWMASGVVLGACLAIMVVGLFTLKSAANTDNEARVKQLMTSAAMTIASMENLASKGVVTDEQAKKIATEILRENKYHPSEYCFVVDDNLNFVAAPMDPQLHGTSFDEFKDNKGQSVGKLALEALRRSGGKLTTYEWGSFNPKTNATAIITSVAIQSPRWKWVVGNGLSDAEANARFWASARWLLPLCIFAAGAVGGGLLLSVRRLVQSLGGEPEVVVQRVQRVASGDLTEAQRGLDETPPPAGSLLFAVEGMRESLQNVMREVHEATQSMNIASHEIASGNQDLSDRTEATASSLQQTSSTMQMLTETVSLSAASAGQARQLAQAASDVAQRGGQVVSEVVSTMEGINASSRRIGDIISVIDGIAFQTNILALNAAVEAARAGEQGRGFAVVAGEVRTLAQRSAQAAREIKSLIGESVERADTGSRLVANAGQTMQDIVTSVVRVSDTISEISASTAEQSAKLTEVGHEISQLDSMTQQNSALVEESAAAAASLRVQADRLAELLKAFTV